MIDPMDTDALRDVTRNEGLWEAEASLITAAADEMDRLRAAIENAPHALYSDDTACPAAYGEEDAVCNCWKAVAL